MPIISSQILELVELKYSDQLNLVQLQKSNNAVHYCPKTVWQWQGRIYKARGPLNFSIFT